MNVRHHQLSRRLPQALGTYESVRRSIGGVAPAQRSVAPQPRSGGTITAAANDCWIRAYSAPFTTPEECVGAIEFPLDAYHQRIREFVIEGAAGVAALKAKPAMLAEGMCDHAIPPEFAIADFEGLWPDRPIVRLPGVGHFCQEDAPHTLIALIEQFMQST
jgi:pimeloyl-ACP methyl ester carboxylesterase